MQHTDKSGLRLSHHLNIMGQVPSTPEPEAPPQTWHRVWNLPEIRDEILLHLDLTELLRLQRVCKGWQNSHEVRKALFLQPCPRTMQLVRPTAKEVNEQQIQHATGVEQAKKDQSDFRWGAPHVDGGASTDALVPIGKPLLQQAIINPFLEPFISGDKLENGMIVKNNGIIDAGLKLSEIIRSNGQKTNSHSVSFKTRNRQSGNAIDAATSHQGLLQLSRQRA